MTLWREITRPIDYTHDYVLVLVGKDLATERSYIVFALKNK